MPREIFCLFLNVLGFSTNWLFFLDKGAMLKIIEIIDFTEKKSLAGQDPVEYKGHGVLCTKPLVFLPFGWSLD